MRERMQIMSDSIPVRPWSKTHSLLVHTLSQKCALKMHLSVNETVHPEHIFSTNTDITGVGVLYRRYGIMASQARIVRGLSQAKHV